MSRSIQTARNYKSRSSQTDSNHNFLETFHSQSMAIRAFLLDEEETAETRMRQIDEFLAANLGGLEDSEVRQGLYNHRKKTDIIYNSALHLLGLIR